MYPPAHVCQALYNKFPDLRLAWHGTWRKFVLVRLSPKHMTKKHNALLLMFGTLWTQQDIINDHGQVETVAHSRGPVFNKNGVNSPDWDLLTTDVIMQAKIDNEKDVFSGKIVHDLVWETRDQQRRNQAKLEHEKGKQLKAEVDGRQEEHEKTVKYYLDRHDGITINTARKHVISEALETEKARPTKEQSDLQYYYVEKRGLKEYL